jgi:hypothetical protein
VLGVDDQLLKKAETEGTSRRIPRDDVAALAVAALTSKSAGNRYQVASKGLRCVLIHYGMTALCAEVDALRRAILL